MLYLLANDPLAPWAQAAAIVILLYLLVSILIGLALALALVLGLTWVRQKAELIKKLRPTVDSVNTTTESALKGVSPEGVAGDNRIVHTLVEVPVYAHSAAEKIDQSTDRVASAVIEFRARTEMVKATLKALFLPGLTYRSQTLLEEGVSFKSPGYRMLVDEAAAGDVPTGPGEGYSGAVSASQLKERGSELISSSSLKEDAPK